MAPEDKKSPAGSAGLKFIEWNYWGMVVVPLFSGVPL